jgi:hypothetical protein
MSPMNGAPYRPRGTCPVFVDSTAHSIHTNHNHHMDAQVAKQGFIVKLRDRIAVMTAGIAVHHVPIPCTSVGR